MTTSRLTVRVTPRASRNALDGWADGVLRVRVTAPPADGKANAAVAAQVATALGIAVRDVAIVSGANSRTKLLEIDGLARDEVEARLSRACGQGRATGRGAAL